MDQEEVAGLGSRIEQFLESLPLDAGFVYGARERLAVNELLLALAARGELSSRPEPLRTLIAPLVCGTKEQQRVFHDLYVRAFAPPEPTIVWPPKRRRRKLWWLLAAVPILIAVPIVRMLLKPAPILNAPVPSTGAKPVPSLSPRVNNPNPGLAGNPTPPPNQAATPAHLFTPGAPVSLPFSTGGESRTVFSPDGSRAVSIVGLRIVLWEPTTGRVIARLPYGQVPPPTIPVVFSPDNTKLAVGVAQPYLVNAVTGQRIAGLIAIGQPASFTFSQDSRYFAAIDASKAEVYEIIRGDVTSRFGIDGAKQAAFSADSKFLNVLTGSPGGIFNLIQFDVAKGSQEPLLTGKASFGWFNSDGSVFADASGALTLLVKKPLTLLFFKPCDAASPTTMAFSANFDWLAASYPDRVCIYNLADPQKAAVSIPKMPESLAVKAILSNMPAGLSIPPSPAAESLSFSADSRWLLTNGPSPGLYWVPDGSPAPMALPAPASGAAFTTDARLLVPSATIFTPGRPRPIWRAAMAAALPVLVLAGFWAWLYQRRARLRRFSLPYDLDTRALELPEAHPPFRNSTIPELAREMRRRKAVPSLDLDIESTLAATIDTCGFLTPVYATWTRQHEFLVLIQKLDAHDQQAKLFSELCDALHAQSALLDVYTFQGSPMSVRDPASGGVLRIEDLAALHPQHDLWIIADPGILQNPFTGELAGWIAELSRWSSRSLFSPVDVRRPLVVALEAAGLRVSVASPDGVAALLETMDSERTAAPPQAPIYPETLENLPLRWLERTPPPGSAAAEMTSDLRRYLGPEGMALLSACATYPELSWPLTLFLSNLLCAPARRDMVLARVASLPWFRHGNIPDWLRARLVARLTPDLWARVSAAVDRFLSSVERFASRSSDGGSYGRGFQRRLGLPGEGRPLRDYIMLEFLAGRKPDEKLAVRPPSALRRLLFKGGHAVFGPQVSRLALAALALSAGAWFAGGALTPKDPGSYRIDLAQWKLPASDTETPSMGASYDSTRSNVNFRVYSSRATRIEVDLYSSPMGSPEVLRSVLTANSSTHIFSGSLPVATLRAAGIVGPVYYGYRAWGPNWPFSNNWTKGSGAGFISDVDALGNRFNPNKLLIDPYAHEISHDPINAIWTDGTVYASGAKYRNIDSGNHAPKSILWVADGGGTGAKPTRAQKDDVIYEVNVRGLTKNDSGVPAALRGTYAGAALKASYLAALGVTAVEFLPVQETQNDANDNTPNSTAGQNYWGYSTLNYFAPDRRYSSNKAAGGPTAEFQSLVKAFHDRGIKVYIDVVYNHTGEGAAWSANDPTTYNILSWRGLDNPTYYELTADMQYPYDNTGAGGNYNTYNPVAQTLIIDSLAYWRDVMGVDGFRLDLAPVLGNTCTAGCFNFSSTDSKTAMSRILRELPPRPAAGGSGVDLYAEPWAIGGNSYQLGAFPAGWSEWNSRYRDAIRQTQNTQGTTSVTLGQLATRLAGSSDLFGSRKPWNSINLVVVHDGFTLNDLYSCNSPNNNQPWPYGPSSGGASTNYSWDQGGAAADQRAAARVGFALMMLSAGTPLMAGGDESLRSLRCNNNAYNVDSVANWLNYNWSSDQNNFNAFVSGMIAFRRAHPALRPLNFYSNSQLTWWTPAGAAADATYLNSSTNRAIAYQIDGSQLNDSYSSIYVAYNGSSGDVNFTLPLPGNGASWYRVTDTCARDEGPNQVRSPGAEDLIGAPYTLCGRGLVLLVGKKESAK